MYGEETRRRGRQINPSEYEEACPLTPGGECCTVGTRNIRNEGYVEVGIQYFKFLTSYFFYFV